jgi:putative ABC transport system permease protein
LPIAGGENEIVFALDGFVTDNAALPVANGNVITPGYFGTMRIPLLRGRDFTDADRASSAPTAIVSESLAERYWPGENPVGKSIRLGEMGHRTPSLPEPARWHTVVGVVGDVRHEDLAEQGRMGVYLPFAQEHPAAMTVVAKTNGDPLDLAEVTRTRVWQVGSGIVVLGVTSMERVLSRSIWSARIFSGMLGSFAFIALALAVVGIYGVVAFTVARRASEIGVRIAMGARWSDVLRLALGNTGRTLLIGLGLGLLGALAASKVVASLVYEVEALDPAAYVTASLTLLLAGLLAGYVPARRAIRQDPADALRCE